MERYSIKMRASNQENGVNTHISGAEKIVVEEELEACCARLLTRALHHSKGKLEETVAGFKGREAALVFNTGFAANSGIIPAVCRAEDAIFSDELNHASIIDGCRQAKAKTYVYRHNDMEDLEKKIRESGCKSGLIVSDAVFSMDGDIVNLPGLVELADRYGLFSMIDEAHATGVIGETGRGALFFSPLSPATVASAIRAIEIMEAEPEHSRRLQENVGWFCGCLAENGVDARSQTAIIPILIGDEGAAVRVSELLMERGCFIPAIRQVCG